MYVLDTHALIWYVTEDDRLGNEALQILEAVDAGEKTAVVPSIVLAEALYISRSEDVSFDTLLRKVEDGRNYEVYPLNLRVLRRMKDLEDLSIHDAVIAATADVLDMTVLSKDEEMQEDADVDTVW
ncbi:MAG: PIN domain-containing protein [Candidatus Nanohaloarchaea archaeon]|nr:PIN domain-containing protein [Candidatus Nanohaloarchaea archaeon]